MQTCYTLEPPWHQNTSTFAPDGEGFHCYPRAYDCGAICTSPTGCTFGAVSFGYAHKYDLGAIGWNTLFRSFDCYADAVSVTSWNDTRPVASWNETGPMTSWNGTGHAFSIPPSPACTAS